MKILAIDPGPVLSAFVLWDTEKHNFFGMRVGLMDNSEWMNSKFMMDLLKEVDLCIIEMIQSYGLGVGRTTFITCTIVGRIQLLCETNNTPWQMYGRPTIAGQIGAKGDTKIRASLRMRYGDAKKGEMLEGVKKDIWAALALAVAFEECPTLKEW